jgi:hypothetical protein
VSDHSWRIYYSDGTAFGNEQGTWEEAPLDGVVMVVLRNGERVEPVTGGDFYALLGQPPDTVAATSDITPLLRQHAPWIKHGVWTSHSNFEQIKKRGYEEFRI